MATKNSQEWIAKSGRAWMGKSAFNPPPPKKIVKGPPPPGTPPTFKNYLDLAGRGMANVGGAVNQVAGEAARAGGQGAVYAGQQAARVAGAAGQIAENTYHDVGGAANRFMQAESQATQPVRDEEAEAAWKTLQYYNYFYGLPYSNLSYKDHLKQLQSSNSAAAAQPDAPGMNYTPSGRPVQPAAPNSNTQNNPQSYAEYMSGAAQTPSQPTPGGQHYQTDAGGTWVQQLDNAGGSSPAAQAVLSQPKINMQWLDYWNGRGPRPATGMVYQP